MTTNDDGTASWWSTQKALWNFLEGKPLPLDMRWTEPSPQSQREEPVREGIKHYRYGDSRYSVTIKASDGSSAIVHFSSEGRLDGLICGYDFRMENGTLMETQRIMSVEEFNASRFRSILEREASVDFKKLYGALDK